MENHTDFINNGLSAIGVYRIVHTSSEEKDATDLTGDTLKPSNIGEIKF